jgi:hypothetical protein
LAGKRITQIITSNTVNVLDRRKMHIAKQIHNKLLQHNLMRAKVDKGKTVIIIDKNSYRNNVLEFLRDNHYIKLQKDPTHLYHKQTPKAMQNCNLIIDAHKKRYLTQIKPVAPTLNALIKLLNDNEPIRPVVNNIHAPTYKLSSLRDGYQKHCNYPIDS